MTAGSIVPDGSRSTRRNPRARRWSSGSGARSIERRSTPGSGRDDDVAGHRGYIRRILRWRRMSGNERTTITRARRAPTRSVRRTRTRRRSPHISRIFRYRAMSGSDFTTRPATAARTSEATKRRIMVDSPFGRFGNIGDDFEAQVDGAVDRRLRRRGTARCPRRGWRAGSRRRRCARPSPPGGTGWPARRRGSWCGRRRPATCPRRRRRRHVAGSSGSGSMTASVPGGSPMGTASTRTSAS